MSVVQFRPWAPFFFCFYVNGIWPLRIQGCQNFVSKLQARSISDSTIMSITGHKTHVMLHRYSHSTDGLRLAAVEGLPAPKAADGDNVVPLARQFDQG